VRVRPDPRRGAEADATGGIPGEEGTSASLRCPQEGPPLHLRQELGRLELKALGVVKPGDRPTREEASSDAT
jgi:hypothetical protein